MGRDGTLELRSRDARFGYVFSSYAESYLPIQYFRLGEARLDGRDARATGAGCAPTPARRCASTGACASAT